VRFGVIGHLAVSEPPLSRGKVRSHKTRGSARAHLSWKARSRVIGHVAASGPTSVGR
jgi:hypothetical protein